MPTDNTDQIAEWNGAQGQRWASLQRDVDRIVRPFGHAALKAAAPRAGENVIYIGCGCGDTSLSGSDIETSTVRGRPRGRDSGPAVDAAVPAD